VPLPAGAWRINVNGITGGLLLGAAEPTSGFTSGQLTLPTLSTQIVGTWDEALHCLTFSPTEPAPNGPPQFLPQFFRGLLFRTPPLDSGVGQDIEWALVGSVFDTALRGDLGFRGSGRRNEFGWHATFTQVV
jgi:hypothetical protein